MKKIKRCTGLTLLLLVVFSLVSCGGEGNPGKTAETAGENVVTGGAVTGGAMTEQADGKQVIRVEGRTQDGPIVYPNGSKNCVYVGTGNYMAATDSGVAEQIKESAVYQLSPEGNVLGYYPLKEKDKLCDVCQVTEDQVYFVTYEGGLQRYNMNVGLWQVPIVTDGGKESLDWEKREQIMKITVPEGEEFAQVFCVTKDYVVYASYSENVYRYDRRTGEIKEAPVSLSESEFYCYAAGQDYVSESYVDAELSGRYVVLTALRQYEEGVLDMDEAEKYFVLDCETWSAYEIKNAWKEEGIDTRITGALQGSTLCFAKAWEDEEKPQNPEDIYCMDAGGISTRSVSERSLVSKEQIEEALSRINPWESNGKNRRWSYVNMYIYQSRLYVEVALDWDVKKSELSETQRKELSRATKDTFDFSGSLVLSLDINEPWEIRYEKGLSHALQKLPEYVPHYSFCGDSTGKLEGQCEMTPLYGIDYMIDGHFFIGINDRPRTGNDLGYYDVETNKSRVIKVEDEKYHLYSYVLGGTDCLLFWKEQAEKQRKGGD